MVVVAVLVLSVDGPEDGVSWLAAAVVVVEGPEDGPAAVSWLAAATVVVVEGPEDGPPDELEPPEDLERKSEPNNAMSPFLSTCAEEPVKEITPSCKLPSAQVLSPYLIVMLHCDCVISTQSPEEVV